jgi:hypothetical protein
MKPHVAQPIPDFARDHLCELRRGSPKHRRREGGRAARAAALVVLLVVLPVALPAQGAANFSGTWKLTTVDPPVPAGRGRGAGGGGISGPYAETILAAAPDSIAIAQAGSQLTVQIGSAKAVYTLDNKTTSDPPGEVLALKTRAHWEAGKLHLHYKQGMNWGRDILTVSGATLTLVRDLESGGASTTRTLTYTKS